jgi:heme-degrading monooxygenase HmoA
MITEVALLDIKNGQKENFENSFKEAQKIISNMKGYVGHCLQECIENKNKYLFTVQWEILEDHTIGFRESKEYLEWKKLLHHFYEPFPIVEHYSENIL